MQKIIYLKGYLEQRMSFHGRMEIIFIFGYRLKKRAT